MFKDKNILDTEMNHPFPHPRLKSKRAAIVLFSTILLFSSFLVLGYFISTLGQSFNKNNRYITVKGLAEKEVLSNIAIWNIGFSASGNNLKTVSNLANQSRASILSFLSKQGFEKPEIENGDFFISREAANPQSPNTPSLMVYNGSIIVRSSHIEKIATANSLIYSLTSSGVLVSSQNPKYIFNEINKVKPELLSLALDNAYKTAQSFALHSQSKVGKIRKANQGVISVVARDTQIDNAWEEQKSSKKLVRMVVTVDYNLE